MISKFMDRKFRDPDDTDVPLYEYGGSLKRSICEFKDRMTQ
jgi:hypothetical protein